MNIYKAVSHVKFVSASSVITRLSSCLSKETLNLKPHPETYTPDL